MTYAPCYDTFSNEMTEKDRIQMELSIHLEEYKAMRAEILEHLKFQANSITFGTSVLAAAAAALGTIYTRNPSDRPLMLFLIASLPILTFVIGMWMVHKDTLASQIALYISSRLRKRIESLVSATDLLGWERFRTERTYNLNKHKPNRLLSTFGHAFFGLFMLGSVWITWYLLTPDIDALIGVPLRILLASDVLLFGVFLFSSLGTVRIHRENLAEFTNETGHASPMPQAHIERPSERNVKSISIPKKQSTTSRKA